MLDTKGLRYFVTVAQLGSFSGAARRLHIAQSALSRHVKALELKLGVVLLRRGVQGVQMTQEGEEFLAHASHVLDQLDLLPRRVGPSSMRIMGRVVVGLPTSASSILAVPLLRAALLRYPGVRIHLIESLSGYLHEWIEAGRLDLAVLFDTRSTPNVRLDPLLVEDLWLTGGAGSIPDDIAEIPFVELAGYPLALPGPSHSHRKLIESAAVSHGLQLNVLAEVDSLTVLKAAVSDGRIFSILPHGAMHQELKAGTLRAARIVEPAVSRSLAIASVLSRSRNQACGAIAGLMLEVAHDLLRTQVWQGRFDLTSQRQEATDLAR